MTNTKNKILKGLAVFLPGISLLGFNIGTGSVTAMAKAGASYGMSLLWTIVASCLTTYFMINLYSRYTGDWRDRSSSFPKTHSSSRWNLFYCRIDYWRYG
jgi:Mn2+/Fe2+ NRAMP family transporter